jgi:hypothetical protein
MGKKGVKKMETRISSTFYYIKTKDEIGETIKTAVFQLENGVFYAYSCYDQNRDKKIIGFGESENDKEAINLSKQDLRKECEAKKITNFFEQTLY